MYKKVPVPDGRVVHKGEKIEVRMVPLIVDGTVIEKEVVVHRGAVVILPLIGEADVILIRNIRIAVDENLWELPAGTLNDAEEPEVCALRELKEETGYNAESIECLGEFFASPGWSTQRYFAFIAKNLKSGMQNLEKDEQITVKKLPLSQIPIMIKENEIIDAKTIATFGLYAAKNGVFDLIRGQMIP